MALAALTFVVLIYPDIKECFINNRYFSACLKKMLYKFEFYTGLFDVYIYDKTDKVVAKR